MAPNAHRSSRQSHRLLFVLIDSQLFGYPGGVFQALFSDMWLQRLEDKDEVEHPFATKLAVPSSLSSSSCASFSFVSPALLSLFFPVLFPFPVFVCSCVPVHRCSCVALRLCSCSGVLILRPSSCARALHPIRLGSVRHVSQWCLVGSLPLSPMGFRLYPSTLPPRLLLILFLYNYCTPLHHDDSL
ncbi:hypothetical protein F5146DRAFT_1067475 [Armillaria mellea]|nr:hypothetical protein F5146DRAFT_1067475 [Armillaria mellea]